MNLKPKIPSIANADHVYMVWNYWDSPRSGIADFQGKPYIFKCQFDEADDDWTDLFWLMEIDEQLLQLAKEQYAIYGRWQAEFKLGNVSIDSYPVLTADRARDDELKAAIGDRCHLQPERSITRRGRFPKLSSQGWLDGGEVQWSLP